MRHIIKLVYWNEKCGDGCCDHFGTRLIINDFIVDNDFYEGEEFLIDIIKALSITEYEIIYEDDAE